MNIQQLFPIIFRRQKARVIDDSAISYLVSGTEVAVYFKDIDRISFTPLYYLIAKFIPITVFDVVILERNGNKHQLININIDGHNKILEISHNYLSIQIEQKETEPGILINGLIRFL